MEIQELQKKYKKKQKEIARFKESEFFKKKELNKLINEKEQILKQIESKVKEENEIIGKRKNQTKYSAKIFYTDEKKNKLKKIAESYYKNYESLKKTPLVNELKRLSKPKKKSRKKFINKRGKPKIKTSFEIFRASNYHPRPINKQAARAVGYRFKKKK